MELLTDYTLKNLATVLGASFSGDDVMFSSVSTDTRNIKKNSLFVALKGPNFDAHDYLDQAKDNGAVAALVSRNVKSDLPQIKVEDTLLALGQMANARRNSFSGKVIGLTGSNGKTTVKELIASILQLSGKVLATNGNFNNDIGLPLTLLRLENNEKFAVIEMGANHPGEINYLSKITRPDIALITNAGAAHLEGFGSLEGVAKAKGEIFGGLTADGTAVINLDDDYAEYWLSVSDKYKQKTFSLSDESADVYATNIQPIKAGSQFSLHINGQKEIVINLPLSGKHNVANALVASAVASVCGVAVSQIKEALESFKMVKGRLTFIEGKHHSTVIDDTYNANLDSTKAALNVLKELKTDQSETCFVFGDLFESGSDAKKIHQDVGQYAREQGIDQLLTVGEMSKLATECFGDGARHFQSKKDLAEYLLSRLSEKSVVLIKGSRGMKMEEIVEQLI